MKEIETFWFTTLTGTVGIVVGEDEHTGQRKAYMGVIVAGPSEQADVERIKRVGSPVTLGIMKNIVERLEGG